jgi:hypothetical protein
MANSCDFAFHIPGANVSAQAIQGHSELTILIALMSVAGINVGYINPPNVSRFRRARAWHRYSEEEQ